MTEFDKTIKCFDEPHTPENIEKAAQVESPGNFLTKAHSQSYLQQMLWIKDCDGVSSIFEVGPGEGFCASNLSKLGYDYETFDAFKVGGHSPNYIGNFLTFSAEQHDRTYDMTCAFQTLEHFPYEKFKENLKKLYSLSNRYIFISIPYSCYGFSFNLNIHFGQRKSFTRKISLYVPSLKKNRKYREEFTKRYPWAVHYWEIGRRQFPLRRIIKDINEIGLNVIRKGHGDNPYHYFILCEKKT